MTPYAPIEVNDWGKNIDYNLFSDAKALQAAQKAILTNIVSQEILILSILRLVITE